MEGGRGITSPPLFLLQLMLWKKHTKASLPPFSSCGSHCYEKINERGGGDITSHPPPLLFATISVVKKTHKSIAPPFFLLLQPLLWKEKKKHYATPSSSCYNHCCEKNTCKMQCCIFMLEVEVGQGAQRHVLMLLLQIKNTRGLQCPPHPSFCCWVCNKKHEHTQTTKTITKQKSKKMKENFTSFNEECCKKTKKTWNDV